MLSRIARVGAAFLCATGLIGLSAAGTAAATPKARTSISHGFYPSADWGFAASVFLDGRFDCSGSVISPTAVVTAAHCVNSPSRMAVRTGSYSSAGGGQLLGVSGVAVPPDRWIRDIAVLRLSAPTSAPPIALATPDEDAAYNYPGTSNSIAGFGARQPNNWQKPKFGALRVAYVHVVNTRACGGRGYALALQICEVSTKRFRGFTTANACPGDSGGPMAALLPEGPRLFGIADIVIYRRHLRYRCGDPLGGAIYQRVSASYDFLQANLGP
jgi:secreted trypsin-like serine protease